MDIASGFPLFLKDRFMFDRLLLTLLAMVLGAVSFGGESCAAEQKQFHDGKPLWALHVINNTTDERLEELAKQLPELAELGINCLMLEVDYKFEYESHPELRQGRRQISKVGARKFAATCRELGIKLVIQFQCVGHQSWAKRTYPLLEKYPEFDLTPGAFPDNKDIYCRLWDPMNPQVNEIVFALMDELIDAFQVDAMHVGMDELFLLTSEHAPSTRGLDPAKVFAKAVNDLHAHLVGKRGVTMLMWADRFIDAKKYTYGIWEASDKGTHPAIDLVPKDIIMCDWHYELRDEYASVKMFQDKGFRVLPSGWNKIEPTVALIRYAQQHQVDDLMIGHLFTTWSGVSDWRKFEPLVRGLEFLKTGTTQRHKLVGTWKVIKSSTNGKEFEYPEGHTTLKHITTSQYMWFSYNAEGKVYRTGGGDYILDGEEYIEIPLYGYESEYSADRKLKHTLRCQLNNGKWVSSGQLMDGSAISETWVRVEPKGE